MKRRKKDHLSTEEEYDDSLSKRLDEESEILWEEVSLKKLPDRGPIAGVCAGLSYYLQVPVWVTRGVFLLLSLGYGIGLFPYIILWIIMPKGEVSDRKFDVRTRG